MTESERSEIFREVVRHNHSREERTLSPYACRTRDAVRRFPQREKIPDGANIRPAFFHDADRIIHSKAYTRYIDKTQVFFLFDNDHITHRVLHVQLVSKIARMIGRCLRLNEDLIEAIALGHDLGHVPYGHDGERFLDRICREERMGYFCHNAQSVRELMTLEDDGLGLNLTLQVLDGVLAHNGELVQSRYEPDTAKTWDQFLAEYHKCWAVPDYSRGIRPMTLEGCVVRLSDVIAYVGRDVDDAVTVGLIRREELPADVVRVLGRNNTEIVNALVLDVVAQSYGRPYISLSADVYTALRKLLDFNSRRIYNSLRKESQSGKIENMFRTLFRVYTGQLDSGDRRAAVYREFLNDMAPEYRRGNSHARIAVDYIAGMTDGFFNNQFRETVLPRRFGRTIDERPE